MREAEFSWIVSMIWPEMVRPRLLFDCKRLARPGGRSPGGMGIPGGGIWGGMLGGRFSTGVGAGGVAAGVVERSPALRRPASSAMGSPAGVALDCRVCWAAGGCGERIGTLFMSPAGGGGVGVGTWGVADCRPSSADSAPCPKSESSVTEPGCEAGAGAGPEDGGGTTGAAAASGMGALPRGGYVPGGAGGGGWAEYGLTFTARSATCFLMRTNWSCGTLWIWSRLLKSCNPFSLCLTPWSCGLRSASSLELLINSSMSRFSAPTSTPGDWYGPGACHCPLGWAP